ncbi:28952_t:CDS:2 [Gigaspora margarita]|uniref:28952_t:CDS:1 n=1 Tax=Gigaspora margarita TaxID=4874 RepID=A0ABN7VWT4_GIGMA|nr:28952_t:CDS:2 [Gigaspora margarita]
MSYNHQLFEIELLSYEQITDLFTLENTSQHTNSSHHTPSPIPTLSTYPPWSPSTELQEIMNKFEEEILYQFPCIPCSICLKLMYPEKSQWIECDINISYALTNAYPNIRLITNPNPPPNRIAICSSCKTNPNRNYPPYFHQIPLEIEAVPLEKRKHLSPVFLHCSLGRTPGANAFTKYRSLVGTMNYSKNFHSLSLYSGILGAFLNSSNSTTNQSMLPPWFEYSLQNAANWLKENNPFFHEYTRISSNDLFAHNPFPSWEPYFYQQLLLRLPCRSEDELFGNYSTYRDHFIARFPNIYQLINEQNSEYTSNQSIYTLEQYNSIIETIISSLHSILSTSIIDIIELQLNSLKILPKIIPRNAIIDLPQSQYYCMQTITNYLGPRNMSHYLFSSSQDQLELASHILFI